MGHGDAGHPTRRGDGLSELDDAVEAIRARSPRRPRVGVVLGSGLGGFAEAVEDAVEIRYGEIAGWPAATAFGHAGTLVLEDHSQQGEVGEIATPNSYPSRRASEKTGGNASPRSCGERSRRFAAGEGRHLHGLESTRSGVRLRKG